MRRANDESIEITMKEATSSPTVMSGQYNADIPITVLTGFLGSGKTTVLNYLATAGALQRTLVLVNEFGEIGLDHDLLVPLNDDTLVAVKSGCICCTIRADLVQTLAEATWRYARNGVRWFDRVIIETTGIADPLPILQTIIGDERVSNHYFLANVVTVVDAINGALTLQKYAEAEKQVAVADRILLTKSDLPNVDLEGLHAAIAELAPLASLNKVTNGRVDVSWFLKSEKLSLHDKAFDFESAVSGEVLEPPFHNSVDHNHNLHRHGGIEASCLVFDHPVDPLLFEACLEMLMAFRGPDLLRMKGIINVAGMDKPMVIHSVQHVFHPPEILEQWPGDDRRTRLVIIARGLDHSELRECFSMTDSAG